MLISAYDIHYQHLPNTESLRSAPAGEPYGLPEVLVIDSGSYEADDVRELADVNLAAIQRQDWSEERLVDTLAKGVDADLPVVIVNFDRRIALPDQIRSARDLFARFPSWRHDFLVKPISDGAQSVRFQDVVAVAGEMRAFDVIGFTEKELGRSLLDRMVAIARIRDALDDADVRAPIHVFGSLDPLLSLLYFISGAEIFDGLGWLYLAFRDGLAVYRDAVAALDHDWTIREEDRRGRMLYGNLAVLQRLKIDMETIVSSGGFSTLGSRAETVAEAERLLLTKVGSGRGR
jgi:hypothetical protein